MATASYAILGQASPAGSNSTLYAVPASTQAVLSTLAVCNTTASAATATIYVCKASGTTPASPATTNALIYQMSIAANTTQTFTIGVSLAPYDTTYVASGTSGSLTFHAFGSQIA